jgi:tetratricopeptide (TPR) repeat protein
MSQRDYILRIAEEFGRAVAQVVYQKQIKDYAAGQNLINEQCKQLLGVGIGFVHSIPEETLLSMLTSFGTLNTEKCWLLASLLKAEGDIYLDQGNSDNSYYSYLQSLNLFLEVLLLDATISGTDFVPELEGLLYKLSEYELPTSTKLKLFQYFDQSGKYARAEDTLFDILEIDPPDKDVLALGIAFYQRLKRKSDAGLEAGNFSRAEVEEGLSQVERMKR